jgi:predicted Fe-Mo cluster-binding NifX family protein
VKTLADLRVDFVLVVELGPGALGLLKRHNIKVFSVKPNTKVADVIKEILEGLRVW